MNDFTVLTQCCLCGVSDLTLVIKLPESPPANELLFAPMIAQRSFPLNLMQCQKCGHHQLSGEVNPERVFSDYLYVSGTNATNRRHFEIYVAQMIERFNPSFVFEIGSNDGTMLSFFDDQDIKILGIDPAKKIAERANNAGITTICDFFTEEQALRIVEEHGQADLVIANNVLAHTSKIDDMIEGIKIVLRDGGHLVFEISYFLDVLKYGLVDLIYNEHLHQHLLEPLIEFFDKHNMNLFDVRHLPNHGGSIRCFVENQAPDKNRISSHLTEMLIQESNINDRIESFNKKIDYCKLKMKIKLTKIKSQGKTIAAFGFPAKGTTLLHTFDLAKYIDFVVDSNPLKQGMFTPGHNLPIYHPDEIAKRNPDYVLILAWNFAENIITNHPEYKGTWIVPLPEWKEYDGL